jgi:hypothetical protein
MRERECEERGVKFDHSLFTTHSHREVGFAWRQKWVGFLFRRNARDAGNLVTGAAQVCA